jgi:hypothetical protein
MVLNTGVYVERLSHGGYSSITVHMIAFMNGEARDGSLQRVPPRLGGRAEKNLRLVSEVRVSS